MIRRLEFPGFFLIALAGLISTVGAVETPKEEFPEPIVLGGSTLVLNGTATRNVFGVRVYNAGLYVSHATNDGESIMNSNHGPKRLKIILLRSVPEAKFVSAVEDNLDNNLTPTEQTDFAEHIAAFFKSFESDGDLNPGSEVTIDYLPEEGMVVMVDGHRRAVIPGRDFYHTLLRLWIGQPLQHSMKTGLLRGAGNAEP